MTGLPSPAYDPQPAWRPPPPDSEKHLDWALWYISLGLRIFPLAPGSKKPLRDSHGLDDSTRDPEVIRKWWSEDPDRNIGVNLGESGLFLYDIDVKNGNGLVSHEMLIEEKGSFPDTPHAFTPSGGEHWIFRKPPAASVPNRSNPANCIAPYIDIKGDGGYVVLPPSIVDGKRYQWEASSLPNESPPTEPPPWLAKLVTAPLHDPAPGGAPRPVSGRLKTALEISNEAGILPLKRQRVDDRGVYHGRCPFPDHEDQRPSFGLFPGNAENPGGFVCSCDQGGAKDLAARLGVDFFKSETKPKAGGKKSAADCLVDIALADAELFVSIRQEEYASLSVDGHREVWPIAMKQFRTWLSRRHHELHGSAPSAKALKDAENVLVGKAHATRPPREVFTRVGEHQGDVVFDLANERWQAVYISPNGWQIIDSVPVPFRRQSSARAVPTPEACGDIKLLRNFLNVDPESDDELLLLAWLLGTLHPRGPYPPLVLNGEQGSAKSTATRVLRSIVDPREAPLRRPPRTEEDLFVAARHSWVVTLENVSRLSEWLSDSLCALATGSGIVHRKKWTDGDEFVFAAARPVILNSITEVATRGDLADRSIVITLQPIPEKRRMDERDFWAQFEKAQPFIVGGLLDAAASALCKQEDTRCRLAGRLPRMADFAVWVEAGLEALGYKPESFLEAYARNRAGVYETVIDADPVAHAIVQLMDGRSRWKGTASELRQAITPDSPPKGWPTTNHHLSGQITRAAPALRRLGIEVRRGHSGERWIEIERGGENPTGSDAGEELPL